MTHSAIYGPQNVKLKKASEKKRCYIIIICYNFISVEL